MKVCTLEDWSEALTESYHALHKRGEPIVLLGAGLGASLCVGLAEQLFPRGLVSLSPILNPNTFPKPSRSSNGPKSVSTEDYLKGGSRDIVSRWRIHHGHLEVPAEFMGLAQQTVLRANSASKKVFVPQLWVRTKHSSASSHSTWKHLEEKACQQEVSSLDGPSRVVWLAPGRLRLYKDVAVFVESLSRPN